MDEPIQPEIAEKIKQLEKKFKNSGQDLGSYLDGLLHDRYLTYWDYIHLDTLLSLQIPRTRFPDEEIFIMYHQITELYFKLIIHELKQILDDKLQTAEFFTKKLDRINRYFRVLINSFDVMIKGMDRNQFLQYRMSLLPASGFQSVQFRLIEIYATPLVNLVNSKERDQFSENDPLEDIYEHLYWKSGATDIKTGEKTLTLKQFEYRYTPRMMRIALRTFDTNVNINWLLMHMGAAYRYLNRDKGEVLATGGTNWKKFLPPSFQKIIFFPNLWNAEEKENWGQQWVTHQFNTTK